MLLRVGEDHPRHESNKQAQHTSSQENLPAERLLFLLQVVVLLSPGFRVAIAVLVGVHEGWYGLSGGGMRQLHAVIEAGG
jgi:hypothetical protein